MTVASAAAQPSKPVTKANNAPGMHTAVLIGPNAGKATAVAEPGYGLFSCQVGLSAATCYDPYQMRTAYGIDTLINAGFDGTGKTIVILDAFQDPNIQAQLAYFNSFYGIPNSNFTQVAPDGLTSFDPTSSNQVGWAEEISLDVLWSHSIAPGANTVLELAKNNSDASLISALNDAIDNNRGDVISMSFGENDACLAPADTAAWHQAFVKAAAKGITLFASTGDEGAALQSCDGSSWVQSTSTPASDPLVVGVSGTELHAAGYCLAALGCDPATNPPAGTYQGEISWNEGAPFGDEQDVFGYGTLAGGGGFSTVWSEPPYQQGTLHGGKQRGVGDVSYNAAVEHGVLTYLDIPGLPAGFYLFGGTSAGAPQWAAIMAIADQKAGHDFGFVNSALYKIGQNAGDYLNSFHDVTSGTNSSLQFDINNNPVVVLGYNAGPGWDATTGIGTPNAGGLISNLPLFWSKGQSQAATSTSQSHGKPGSTGSVSPH
jgi:subtilase family serine protease